MIIPKGRNCRPLSKEIWTRIAREVMYSPPGIMGKDVWQFLHQGDLAAMMRVNAEMHNIVGPLLYAKPIAYDVKSLFYGLDDEEPIDRPSKVSLLSHVCHLTLIHPPVQPLPPRNLEEARIQAYKICLQRQLLNIGKVAIALEAYEGPKLLPNLTSVVTSEMEGPRWELWTDYIESNVTYRREMEVARLILRRIAEQTIRLDSWCQWSEYGPFAFETTSVTRLKVVPRVFTHHANVFFGVARISGTTNRITGLNTSTRRCMHQGEECMYICWHVTELLRNTSTDTVLEFVGLLDPDFVRVDGVWARARFSQDRLWRRDDWSVEVLWKTEVKRWERLFEQWKHERDQWSIEIETGHRKDHPCPSCGLEGHHPKVNIVRIKRGYASEDEGKIAGIAKKAPKVAML